MGGDKLSHEDILDILFLFIIAGLDTVSDSLTCFFAFLAQHPEHRRQIVEDPGIIPSAVEELLRWESPVPSGVPRVATEDVVLPGGQKVSKGTAVVVSYGAADVDPATFGDPFEVRLGRAQSAHRVRWRCPPLSRVAPGERRGCGSCCVNGTANPRLPAQARP